MQRYLIENEIISGQNIEKIHNKTRDHSDIDVLRCTDSGCIFLDKIIKTNYEAKGLGYWNAQTLEESRSKTFPDDSRRCEFTKQYIDLKGETHLLDFGCGNGGFLHLLPITNKFGFEINSTVVDMILQNNNDQKNIFTNLNQIEKKFDVITMFHVLEHLQNPIEILESLKNVLKPARGFMIIEVPSARDILFNAYDCKAFKDFTFWSEHLVLYTKETLRQILQKAGFSNVNVLGIQRYNIYNHLYWLTRQKPGGQNAFQELSRSKGLIDEYNKFLEKSDYTDTLIAIAKIN